MQRYRYTPQLEALLNPTEKAKFRDITNKRDKTNDEQFLCELIHWIAYPSQLNYLYTDANNGNCDSSRIAYSPNVSRQSQFNYR